MAEQLTDQELAQKVVVILQEWPLYRQLHYTGAVIFPRAPEHLSLFCNHPKCGFKTSWSLAPNNTPLTFQRGVRGESINENFHHARYYCKNCGVTIVRFFFYWLRKESEGTIAGTVLKVGQFPELEERISENLENALGAEDLKVYKNALRMRNFNYGIAAMAYMRRVVENRMNDILEVLYEAAKTHNAPAGVLAKHEAMMKEKRFADKVNYAGDLLPKSLRPDGHPNPMGVLHELASDGLHAKSDADCVDIFDACKQTFEYVFGKMRLENEEARKFVKGMVQLSSKRAEIASAAKPAVTETSEESRS